MKKLLTLALALTMAAAWSIPAQAVDLSGEIMIRGEAYNNADDADSDAPDADRFTAQRTTLNIDASPVEGLIAHVSLEAAQVWGGGVTDCNFVSGDPDYDINVACSDSSNIARVYESWIAIPDLFGTGVTGKFGRQQINLGAERIVGTDYEWQMHPASFDAWAFVVPAGPLSITLADVKLGEGGQATGDTDLYVLYATAADYVEGHSADLYYMNLSADAGTANVNIDTMGLRLNGAVAGFDYELEYATQSGDDGAVVKNDIGGAMINLEVGYSLPDMYNLRFFVGMDQADGDDITTNDDESWQDISPSVDKHLGAFDYFTGFSNIESMHVGITTDVSENCSLGLSYWTFEESEESAFPGSGTDEASEIDFFIDHKFNDNLVGTIGYSTLDYESATAAPTDPEDTATFSYLQLKAHF